MKLNKTFGRIATTLVATAMLASMAVVPAFAEGGPVEEPPAYGGVGEDGTQYEDGNAIQNLTFKKVLQLPENVPVPDIDFTFTLKGAKADPNETVRGKGNGISTNLEVYDGNGEITGTASFTTGMDVKEVKDGVVSVESVVNIPLSGLTFDDAGVYKYTLSENELADTVPDKAEYILSEDTTVYLYVARQEEAGEEKYIVTGVVMLQPGKEYSESNKSDGKLVNTYLLDEKGDPKVNELTVAKQVAGAMGNRSEDFTFTVKILYRYDKGDEQNTGKTYTAVYEVWSDSANDFVVDGTKAPITFTAEQAYGEKNFVDWAAEQEFTLSHNERIHIYGLSAKDQCQVKETNSGTGYKVTYKSNSKDAEGKEYIYDMGTATGVVAYLRDIKDEAKAINMTFINTRNAVSPTGLVMDIAPYVLLVVAAAAGCFIFMRKRRED